MLSKAIDAIKAEVSDFRHEAVIVLTALGVGSWQNVGISKAAVVGALVALVHRLFNQPAAPAAK